MSIQLSDLGPDRAVFEVDGVLDRHSVPAVRKLLHKIMKLSRIKHVEIRVSRVTSIDTAGVALLVDCLRIQKKKAGDLAIVELSQEALRMIRLARVEDILNKCLVHQN